MASEFFLALKCTLPLPPSLQTPKAILQLHPSFHVSLAHTSGYHYPLQLAVADHPPLFLAASTYHLMNQWLYHLQTQRILQDKFGEFPQGIASTLHHHYVVCFPCP